jgi:3-dehydroquinate synthase
VIRPRAVQEEVMTTLQQHFNVAFTFPVIFTRDVFAVANGALADVVRQGGRPRNLALIAVDDEVVRTNPDLLERVRKYMEAHAPLIDLVAPPFTVRGGEICKHDPVEVDRIYALVERYKICRHSYIIAIGGGAVLDAVGFAAATVHRGVRLIRIPTTVLAQNDAGIGVKNGVNAFGRKNFIGSFSPPYAVINDTAFLQSLPIRDIRAGMAEAIKVALIRDPDFFDDLYEDREALALFSSDAIEKMIFRCAQLHLQHIATAGDPFEHGSSRPLDFGHWVAHKLEELPGSDIRHGEAVAVGIALDSLYSHHIGLLGEHDLYRVLALLEGLGFHLSHPSLPGLDVETALGEFREHLGGELSIPLLEGIGRKVEAHEIDIALMKRCMLILNARSAGTDAGARGL